MSFALNDISKALARKGLIRVTDNVPGLCNRNVQVKSAI